MRSFRFLAGGVGVGYKVFNGGEPNLLAMFFENLYPHLTPCQKSKTSHKVHKLYQFLPSYSFLSVSRQVARPQCEPALKGPAEALDEEVQDSGQGFGHAPLQSFPAACQV